MDTYICPVCRREVLYADKKAHECKPTCDMCHKPIEAIGLCVGHLNEMADIYELENAIVAYDQFMEDNKDN